MKVIQANFERVKVRDFLAIRFGELVVDDVTAVIGPQASGKSIYAKLIYFGRTYLEEYFTSVFSKDFDIRSFKKVQTKRFLALFGNFNGYSGGFEVDYSFGDYELQISRQSERHIVKISTNSIVDKCGGQLKREYQRFVVESNKDPRQAPRGPSEYLFRLKPEGAKAFFESVPKVLFVPASRSFYSALSEEIFTFLASDERIDPLIAQFGSFYEFAKRKADGEWYSPKSVQKQTETLNRAIRPVVAGDFHREQSKDYIRTAWGRVPLRSSSSGQQEALPLLFSLLDYPGSVSGSHLLIIEEPEAHLFPTAQKYVLDLMMQRVMETECEVLLTTHSPYVLACINTHIARLQSKKVRLGRAIKVSAYMAHDGGIESIIEPDSGLIDTNLLDDVSQSIATEFLDAINE